MHRQPTRAPSKREPAVGRAGLAPQPEVPSGLVWAMSLVRDVSLAALRRYHRHEISVTGCPIDDPVLFVANHGFGGIIDINVLATLAALEELPLTILTHEMAWTFKVGTLIEAVGAARADRSAPLHAFARGNHVLVFPGGDHDAAKPWCRRNEVVFHGRTGFAQLALDAGVPLVPVATAGAGESLLVLSDGTRLARWLRARLDGWEE